MFLQEIRKTGVPDLDLIDAIRMKKRFAYRQKIWEDLRKRFRTQYLGQLQDFTRNEKETQLKERDTVLIGHDNSKRINWPLGKTEAIYPGKNNRTCVNRVKTQSGSYLRPVRRIYLLEVQDNEKETTFTVSVTVSSLYKNRPCWACRVVFHAQGESMSQTQPPLLFFSLSSLDEWTKGKILSLIKITWLWMKFFFFLVCVCVLLKRTWG